jgi:hypothetical protein
MDSKERRPGGPWRIAWTPTRKEDVETVYETFQTWQQVIDYVDRNGWVYYHAPLDYRPVRVVAKVKRRRSGCVIRVTPPTRDADPFDADEAHLNRFKVRVDA